MGAAPRIISILYLTWLIGGNPGRSSGNMLGKSRTSGMSLSFCLQCGLGRRNTYCASTFMLSEEVITEYVTNQCISNVI